MSSSTNYKLAPNKEELAESAEINARVFKTEVAVAKLNHLVCEREPHLAAKLLYLADRLEIDRSKQHNEFKHIVSFNKAATQYHYPLMRYHSIGNDVFAGHVMELFNSLVEETEKIKKKTEAKDKNSEEKSREELKEKFQLLQFSYIALAHACIGSILAVLNHPDYRTVNKSLMLKEIANEIKAKSGNMSQLLAKKDDLAQRFFKHLVLTFENFYKFHETRPAKTPATKTINLPTAAQLIAEIDGLKKANDGLIPRDLKVWLRTRQKAYQERLRSGNPLSEQEEKRFFDDFLVIKMKVLSAIDRFYQALRSEEIVTELKEIEDYCKALQNVLDTSDILRDLGQEKAVLGKRSDLLKDKVIPLSKQETDQSLKNLSTIRDRLFAKINAQEYIPTTSSENNNRIHGI